MQATKSAAPATIPAAAERQGLVQWAASKFGVEIGKVFPILKATCFRGEVDKSSGEVKQASDAEVAALMIVAREHGLNPFLKEIYAFPDKKGGIVPVVGVDGWIRIVNEHKEFNGVEFIDSEETITHNGKTVPVWREVHFYRKDRTHAIKIREFFSEVVRDTQPWKSHPNRMFRHKAYIQGARVAFGFAGIYDEDEAERIIEGQIIEQAPTAAAPARGPQALKAALADDGINVEPPPAPAHDSGAKRTEGRPAGTLELREQVEKDLKACTNIDLLDIARDMANGYEWTKVDLDYIDQVYKARRAELAG